MLDAIRMFSSMSGLLPNNCKSVSLFGNVPSATHDFTIATFDFNRGTLLVTYLGLLLISGKLNLRDCQPLLTKINSKMETWGSKYISQAGKAQLMKLVIYGL